MNGDLYIRTYVHACKYTGQCTMCQMHTIIYPGAQPNLSLYRGVVVTSRGRAVLYVDPVGSPAVHTFSVSFTFFVCFPSH